MKKATETTPASAKATNRKDAMRAAAAQGAASAPGITERIQAAQAMAGSHPLRADRNAMEPSNGSGESASPAHPAPEESSTSGAVDEKNTHVTAMRGTLELVPLGLIVPNPFNARRTYRQTRINEMKASLVANGQETPGTATIRDGKYVLAAGHYRLEGLQLLDAPKMALIVIPGLSDRALYEMSYRENAEREEQTAYDNAIAWRELLDKGVYESEEELAKAVSMSASNVNKTLSAHKLSQAIRDLVAEDPARFKLSVLYELSLFEQVGGSDRALFLANAVAAGEIGRQQIQDARNQLQTSKPRKGRESSRQYQLQVAGESGGILKEWPSGKVAFEVNITDPLAREQFVNELRARFEKKDGA
jgi:ParB family chromosome partitioning protein